VALRSPHSAVFVQDADGKPLMPASPGRIRRLLDDHKATLIPDPSFFVIALTQVVTQPQLTPVILGIAAEASQVSFFVISRDARTVRVHAHIILPLEHFHHSPYIDQVAVLSAADRDSDPLAFMYDELALSLRPAAPLIKAIYDRLAALAPITHIAFHQDGRHNSSSMAPSRFAPTPLQEEDLLLHEIQPHGTAPTATVALTQRFLVLSHHVTVARPSHVACVVVSRHTGEPPPERWEINHLPTEPQVLPPYILVPSRRPTPDTADIGSIATVRLLRPNHRGRSVRWGIITASPSLERYHVLMPKVLAPAMRVAWHPVIVERADVDDIYAATPLAILPIFVERVPI
jgi:RRXRR protein